MTWRYSNDSISGWRWCSRTSATLVSLGNSYSYYKSIPHFLVLKCSRTSFFESHLFDIKISISVTVTLAASFFHGNQDFTVNVLTRCKWSIQLEWGYGAISYLREVVVLVIIQNESLKIYFWYFCHLKYQFYIFRKFMIDGKISVKFHSKWID